MKDANIPQPAEKICRSTRGESESLKDAAMTGELMDYYEVIVQHQVAFGQQPVKLGTPDCCRYCGTADEVKFQQVAHAFPEALGNHWLISLDECDDCNAKFSIYDAALTEAVGSFLTLGGVPRKHGPTRKFGRSSGTRTAMHTKEAGRRHLSFKLKDTAKDLGFPVGLGGEILRIRIPMPDVAFIPVRAYKALAKMGFALIPDHELNHFESERAWLLGLSNASQARDHHVVASFGIIGNAPPLVTGCLLRRRDPTVPLPYMLFVGCIGSICMQVAIKADVLDAHVPPDAVCQVNLQWVNVIGAPGEPEIRIAYDHRVEWEWGALESTRQPVEAMILTLNQRTLEGVFEPVFR
jgi:hypothetical protein